MVSISNTNNVNGLAASTPPQIGLDGGTLLATASLTTPLKQGYSRSAAPSPTTSAWMRPPGVTLHGSRPNVQTGSMGVNITLASSTGTVFIQSNEFTRNGERSACRLNSTAVTGTGTSFTTDVKIGDQFCSGGFAGNVVAIGSNTALTHDGEFGRAGVTAGNIT